MNRYLIPSLVALAAVASQLAPFPAQAQTPALPAPDDNGERTRIGVGGVALVAREGYKGVGTETTAVPGISVQNKWISLFGPQLDLRLVGNADRSWWLGPRVEYRFDGYEASDSAFLTGMAERKSGVFAGLAGRVEFGDGYNVEVDAVHATRDERGLVGSLELGRTWLLGRSASFSAKPRVGLEYSSAKYVKYYYGVRPSEATATRAAYTGKSATSFEVGLDLRWRMAPKHYTFANLNYERYAQAIHTSPIINKRGIAQMVVGYQYLIR